MKKFVCFFLAAALAVLCAAPALADVTAQYNDGKITVSTDEVGFWEISIDNVWVGYWVGNLHPNHTFSMPLEDGEHTVSIFNVDSNSRRQAKFYVGEAAPEATAEPGKEDDGHDSDVTEKPAVTPAPTNTPAPTATPAPKGPVKLNSVSFDKGVMKFNVSGLRGYAEIWLDGVDTGLTLKENGEITLLKVLDGGKHTLALYVPTYDEITLLDFTSAEYAPDAEELRETLESLVKNLAGDNVGAGLSIDSDDSSYVLRVSVDDKNDAILTITKDQLQTLLDQGLNILEYVNGKAALRVDLTKITDDWFKTEEPITAYTFRLVAEDNAAQITVSALTETETVQAEKLVGVTLIRGSQRVNVKQNGIY